MSETCRRPECVAERKRMDRVTGLALRHKMTGTPLSAEQVLNYLDLPDEKVDEFLASLRRAAMGLSSD